MQVYDTPNETTTEKMVGKPGTQVRIVPKSDPNNWYAGPIVAVFVEGHSGLPLAYQILNESHNVVQVIPWDAIESVTFLPPTTEEPTP